MQHDALLGVSALAIGLVFQAVRSDKVIFAVTLKQLSDFLEFPGSDIVVTNSDGVNTFLSINLKFPHEFILKYEDGDFLKVLITEDLTGFLRLRGAASGKLEQRLVAQIDHE